MSNFQILKKIINESLKMIENSGADNREYFMIQLTLFQTFVNFNIIIPVCFWSLFI